MYTNYRIVEHRVTEDKDSFNAITSFDADIRSDRVTILKPRQLQLSRTIIDFVFEVFLPRNYPHSVSPDYAAYQIWDSLQAFCSGICSALTTQSVLRVIGVGDEMATPLAATLTWLMKDGAGMVGRIVFAWLKGSYLDSECKKWRLFADILNDLAMFVQLIGPALTSANTLVLSVSSVIQSIVGVAGGATRAAVTQHQARDNNMADVSAKDGSQETMVNLLALVVSLLLIPLIGNSAILTWILFVLLVVLHLLFNYLAVNALTMDLLNEETLSYCVQSYLEGRQEPTLRFVNKQESVFVLPRFCKTLSLYWRTHPTWYERFTSAYSLRLGCSIGHLLETIDYSAVRLRLILDVFSNDDYLIYFTNRKKIFVAFRSSAGAVDATTTIKAYLNVLVLWRSLQQRRFEDGSFSFQHSLEVLRSSQQETQERFEKFLDFLVRIGFRCDVVHIIRDSWSFDVSSKE